MSASRQRCAYTWNTEICSQQLLDAIVHERSLMTWTSVYWRRKSTQRVSHRFDDGQDRRLWAEDVEGSKSIEFSGPPFLIARVRTKQDGLRLYLPELGEHGLKVSNENCMVPIGREAIRQFESELPFRIDDHDTGSSGLFGTVHCRAHVSTSLLSPVRTAGVLPGFRYTPVGIEVVQGVCVDRRERNQVLAPSARLERDRSFPRQGIDCDEYLVPGAGGESIGQCIQSAGALLFQLSDNEGLCLIELGHVIPL